MNVQVSAQILQTDGSPAERFSVALEVCHPSQGWRRVGPETSTRPDGSIRISQKFSGPELHVPALRLVRGEGNGAQVLAQIGSFQAARNAVTVAFGPLVLLPDRGIPLPGAETDGLSVRTVREERLVAAPQLLARLAERPPERPAPAEKKEREESGSRTLEALKELLTVETARVDQLQVQLDRRNKTIGALEKERAALRDQLAEAREALEVVRKSEEGSPTVDSLAGAISGALNQSRSLGGLELSNAEIRLRGIVSEAGSRFHPLDAAEARTIHPENVSELTLRLVSPKTAEGPPDVIPDVVGQTVNSARRKALAVGLDLEVIEEIAPGRPAGAIISQAPEPGQTVKAAGGALSVVVAVPRMT